MDGEAPSSTCVRDAGLPVHIFRSERDRLRDRGPFEECHAVYSSSGKSSDDGGTRRKVDVDRRARSDGRRGLFTSSARKGTGRGATVQCAILVLPNTQRCEVRKVRTIQQPEKLM